MTRIATNKSTTLQKVASMVHDRQAEQLAAEFGLAIQNVSWEDCARDKQSVWGPCISDMTLQVDNTPLPVIRLPNFTDVTWDQPMKNIPLNVGNEKGKNLKQISLHEYLANVQEYLHCPNSGCRSLLAPSRDSHVIMSSQACFLPIEEGKDTKFNVCLHNYQSYPNNPAVLVIIASSSGTSAQIVDQSSQTLYFNKNGEKASFVAQRLKDQRRERGEQIEGEMTAEEKSDNMLLIIQVPVKQKDVRRRVPEKLRRKAKAKPMAMACESALCDVDEAMISVGDSEGKFSELKSARIERDERFPVRVTLQYYKATSNGVINDQVVEQIAVQMVTARSFAAHNEIGSLVTSDSTEKPRPTEAHSVIPLWWNSFWRDNYYLFPDMSENQAKELAFTNSHITSMKCPDAKKEVLSILQRSIKPSRPLWDPSVPF